jgi:predicted GH43/DUF377 family glycosyl hydrolase
MRRYYVTYTGSNDRQGKIKAATLAANKNRPDCEQAGFLFSAHSGASA